LATTATKKKSIKETPLMGQYNRIKAKYPDALLLFRVGDFYETFSKDAIITAEVLGIVLTKRANGSASHVELAGFPYHALDTYLPKLVKAGYRVAICEQLEDPKATKKIVKRGVTELITPGIAVNDKILDRKSNNFLASVFMGKSSTGIAFLDISTGEFFVSEGDDAYIDKIIQGFNPSEVILPKSKVKKFREVFGTQYYTYPLEDWIFDFDYTYEKLLLHFNTKSLKGFGVESETGGIIAAGAVMHYVASTEHNELSHISTIARLPKDDFVWLDKFTIRNLELFATAHSSGIPLIEVIDRTLSPMGARLLKKWLMLPLKNIQKINERLHAVEYLIKENTTLQNINKNIKLLGDLERLISKVSMGKVNPREVLHIKKALDVVENIQVACKNTGIELLETTADQLNPCDKIRDRIGREIRDDAPLQLDKGSVIKAGVSEELDEWTDMIKNGKQKLIELQQKEILNTGISSLKIGFNNVFGYYLEVTHRFKNQVPEHWIRKQTLVNAERYITPELKEYEEKIMSAEDRISAIEKQLYRELVNDLAEYIQPVQLNAFLMARLDCLQSFAVIAQQHKYRMPKLDDSYILNLEESRHPVIEQSMQQGESFVPNNIYLDNDEQQIIIITGPNMAGKSALLRQAALICIMAQMGSFVPAKSAKIGLIDKIFTRVGASDNLSSGESTFMVEMNETASIINNISDRSLVLLDEIGRGTSTYDGISIAWSIAEFLHNNKKARPKTLFATHYHELNDLAAKFPRIKNFTVSVREAGERILFLRKLVPGGSGHSFGIHVARMAGMPKELVERANEIMHQLEQKGLGNEIKDTLQKIPEQSYQLSIFEMDNPAYAAVIKTLQNMDINSLTPVEALMKLNELKEQI
jgi:DNA mismatch repair protein MutS